VVTMMLSPATKLPDSAFGVVTVVPLKPSTARSLEGVLVIDRLPALSFSVIAPVPLTVEGVVVPEI
jgi:hypothetical protein